MEINMTYAIMGAGLVGATLARFFAAKDIPVLIANSRGPETRAALAAEIGPSVRPANPLSAVRRSAVLHHSGERSIGRARQAFNASRNTR